MPNVRNLGTVPGFLVLVCVVAALGSRWTIGIPQADLADAFGFQNLFCWLAVACALGALVVEERRARVAFLILGEGVLLAWFGWAMWVVTSPRFAPLQWPFVGIDLVGPSWYIAGLAILIVAAFAARNLSSRPAGMDVWLLAAFPGSGLVRLDHWTRGLTWTLLFASALLLASFSSPDMSVFEQFRSYSSLPPVPVTRWPTWALLAASVVIAAFSVADTARIARRSSIHLPALRGGEPARAAGPPGGDDP